MHLQFASYRKFVLPSLVVMLTLSGCGKPGISGKVTVDETPVAAGTITFEANDGNNKKLIGVISNGAYKIESEKITAGEYSVKIDIHFANANEAKDFYANMSKELNKEKILHGDTPELVDQPDEENSEDEVLDENGEPKPKIESPLKSHTFQATLNRGANVKDFKINN